LYKQEVKEEVISCDWNWCWKLPQILQKFLVYTTVCRRYFLISMMT